jgi:hypothetical protein
MRSSSAVVIALFSLFSPAVLLCQHAIDRATSTCEQETLAEPGIGVSYRGTIRNDDYRFSATIPDGLLGWGAAPSAPFHGFSIFLNTESGTRACIVFRIAVHVDLEEDKPTPEREGHRLERITVGGRSANRTSSVGSVRGVVYENVNVWLQVSHKKDDTHDVEIVLVTPKSDAVRTRAIFDGFIASLRFF